MTWLLLSIVIAATAASDLLQSYEMKRLAPQPVDGRGLANLLKTIARRRYLILSIACLAVSFFSFMALVQTAPLSFAVPASAGSFIVETILAKFVLKEHVGARRAAGVTGGVGRHRAAGALAATRLPGALPATRQPEPIGLRECNSRLRASECCCAKS